MGVPAGTSLNEEELDFIEYYLGYRDQIRRNNILFTCAGLIDRLVRYDPNRYVICRGVKLVVHMLHRLKEWVTGARDNMPKLLKEAAGTIRGILYGSELEEVLEQTSDEKPVCRFMPSINTIICFVVLVFCL